MSEQEVVNAMFTMFFWLYWVVVLAIAFTLNRAINYYFNCSLNIVPEMQVLGIVVLYWTGFLIFSLQ